MVGDLDRLRDEPYRIRIFSQKFGGKVTGDIKGRGKAKGLMKYTDITRSSVDLVGEIEDMVRKTYQSIRKRKSPA